MREKEKATSIIYVRHGQADFPHDRLYCDEREDPSLTAEGLAQAQLAATLLADQAIEAIYSSPMMRTRMTAELIADKSTARVIFEPRLKERPFGIWDGLYFDEIARDYPDQFLAWKRDPISFVPEGGETIDAHMDRVKSALQDIIDNHRGQRILVVSHVGPIRMCITDALGMPLSSYRRLTIDYASVTRVDYGRKQNNLIYMNISGKL
ncbi:MAG: histidine phosphatase family protein [Gammaproteobacteria bacterium]|nr:histidine phosphatase family protein [Gammaproteobacteria bacterium]